MDYTALSSWHSASSGEPRPLVGASTLINGLEVEVYTSDPGFYHLVDMPADHLRFSGVLKNRQGFHLLLSTEKRLYWRLLRTQEYEIIQLWWRELPERNPYPDQALRQIEDYLKSVSPGTMVVFLTKYDRKVRITRQGRQILYGDKWTSFHNRRILAKAAQDATEFWVCNRREPATGAGMGPQVFFAFITPRQSA